MRARNSTWVPRRSVRIVLAAVPVAGTLLLTGAAILNVYDFGPTVFSVAFLALCPLIVLMSLAGVRFYRATDRHVTPAMESGYRVLREWAQAHRHARGPVAPPDADVLILAQYKTNWRHTQCEFWRVDRDAVEAARASGDLGADPLVFERFVLAEEHPMVWHSFAAATVDAQGRTTFWGQRDRRQRAREWVRAMVGGNRTALDMASAQELDELIHQLRLASAS